MWLPQPKYWLWLRSGATIRSISSCSLVLSQVGIRPSVSPLCGSVSIAGMGMNGAVAGSSQRMSPDGAGAGAAGAGGAAAASAPPAPRAVASSASAHTVQQPVDLRRDLDTLASALWVPSIGALDTGGSEPRRGPSRLMVSLMHRLVPHPAARDGGTMLHVCRGGDRSGTHRHRQPRGGESHRRCFQLRHVHRKSFCV